MKIDCLHGYFLFDELKPGQIQDFSRIFGFEIESLQDGLVSTFASLKDAPFYSIQGGEYLGAPCVATYCGRPWDIMKANDLVYDFTNDQVVNKYSITQVVEIYETNKFILSGGLIQPGSITTGGLIITGYTCFFDKSAMEFKYKGFIYD
jgi:hypothetical protein